MKKIEGRDIMYSIAIKKCIRAKHALITQDAGDEQKLHYHDYAVKVILFGENLDSANYLIDVKVLGKNLDDVLNDFEDEDINALKEFRNENPSTELLCKVICNRLLANIDAKPFTKIEVCIDESDAVEARFRKTF